MRIIVYPHDLFVGGSQINAIDLAAAVRDLGHQVCVYGIPGPLVEHVQARGLSFVAAPSSPRRPSPHRIAHLARLARRDQVDVIHGYEWPPCLDAYFGAHLVGGVGLLCTVLSMAVSPLVPRSIPLIMGTAELGRTARTDGFADVTVIEPPIDTVSDHPGIDGGGVRAAYGVGPSAELVVSVSRLAIELKLDALERAIDAVALLAEHRPIRLLIVGEGEAQSHLRARAGAVNARRGREVVTLVGQQLDPRPFYAAADVVVAMGSSALRAMSIGRPVVVQGERGFSEVCEPDTSPMFLRNGFWGIGGDEPDARRLAGHIQRLLDDAELRASLGAFGRTLVVERFDLRTAAQKLLLRYEDLARRSTPRVARDAAVTAVRAGRAELRLHDPRRKRARSAHEAARLAAAAVPGRSVQMVGRRRVDLGAAS